ncbi:HAD family hydrolase [Sporosarcina oncorhynchi]|uniref:Phosphoserine phosphatase n=1 Tax=Sporosarcina oncorhynchi TaxID=3056444 RepID=A0ABZ0L8P8_9BACL|nr:HAD family hydrolase [Sporosarcina sp. T2O-4]WOV88458.1 HAD family hydrolase [Sporosarcina sp. T2O-4]
MIKTIIFDLDDTLLWDKKSIATAFENTCKYAAELLYIDAFELENAVREAARKLYATYDTYEFTQNIGINPFEGLWGIFDDAEAAFGRMKEIIPHYQKEAWTTGLQKMGIHNAVIGEKLAAIFIEERKMSPFVYEETFSVLDQLKGNYTLVLLTNGAPSLQNTKLEITPELKPYFDEIIISGAFGKGKPDPSIFEYVMKKTGHSAGESLMIGDNLMTDILGSSRVGMRSVWINRENQPKRDEIQATYEINHLEELFPILDQLGRIEM